jgi:nicotinate-nucleotide pyrophosphorylase (carboxylating)
MLDNFEPSELKEVAARLKAIHPHVTLEASGGITKATIGSFMGPAIDVISQGRRTHGYSCLDFSLKRQPPSHYALLHL